MQRIDFGYLMVVGLSFFSFHAGANAASILDLDGAWFSCEYAHSQIAPGDDCKMLDDDGFLIKGTAIDYIKVSDSSETDCRRSRVGHCFRRNVTEITVLRESTGTFQPTVKGFQISYWGCLQDYEMVRHESYVEIRPVGDFCLWTSDKRYFLARYEGILNVTEKDPTFSLFSSDR